MLHCCWQVVFSFFRDGCCFPVLLIAAALAEGSCLKMVPKTGHQLSVFALLGVTGMWGNQLFYILGLYYTNATIASCWQPSIPVFATVIAVILGVEKFPPVTKAYGILKIVGVLCAFGGAIVLVLGKDAGAKASDDGSGSDGSDSAAIYSAATGYDELQDHQPLVLGSSAAAATNTPKAPTVQGQLFLLMNCGCMALYLNIQKIFIHMPNEPPNPEHPMSQYKENPITVTAWSYFFVRRRAGRRAAATADRWIDRSTVLSVEFLCLRLRM